MSDRRSWRLDAAAGVLLLLGLLLTVAVVRHDPADLDEGVYPLHATPHNLLGLPGAWVARALVGGLGFAAYVFLATWFVLVLLLFLRRGWLAWGLRLTGWLLLTPCAAVVADRFGGAWPGSPPAGPGGSVGAWLSIGLAAHLVPWAQAVLLGACVLFGLALGADVLVRRLPRFAWWGLRSLWGAAELPSFSRRAGGVSPLIPRPVGRRVKDQGADAPRSPEVEPQSEAPTPPETRAIPIVHHHAAAHADAHGKTAVVPTDQERYADYKLPPLSLLEDPTPLKLGDQDQVLRDRAALLEKTFTDFGLNVRVVGINTGPVVTQFELALETGLRLHKVTQLADDVALNLKAPSVRMVAPIPGKNTVGVEIPNEQRAVVRLKEVILTSGEEDRQEQDAALSRQGRGGPAARPRPGRHAAPADRRRHRHRQVGLHERHHPQHADDAPAGRAEDDHDRPQGRRAERVRGRAAPDAPRHQRHEKGRGRPRLGRGQDGGALRPAGPCAGPQHRRL